MTNVEELRKKEIQELTENEELTFEQLIIQGSDARVPIQIDYPFYNGEEIETRPVVAMIKPITNADAQKAYINGTRNPDSTPNAEIVKAGFLTKDLKPFDPKLIDIMPGGVIDTIAKQIMDLSGITIDMVEAEQLMRKMLGF